METNKSRASKWITNNGVKIYPPSGRDYWRIVWTEDGKARDTSAKSEPEALNKASEIEQRLRTTNGKRSMLTVKEMYLSYVDEEQGGDTRHEWGKKHTRNTKQIFLKTILPAIGEKQCAALKAEHLKKLVSQKMTTSNRQHLLRTLTAFMKWGYREGWILEEPTRLLAGLTYVSKVKRKKGSPMDQVAKVAGESNLAVDPKAIPSKDDVQKLGRAISELTGIWWMELMVNLAAYSGLRLGEILDLDLSHVDIKNRIIKVEYQLLDDAGNLSRQLPKWDVQRRTVFPVVTPAGYKLAEQLQRRLKEVKSTHKIPTLQDGTHRLLLFPNSNGGWIGGANFSTRIRRPAQELAGWAKDPTTGKFVWNFHSLRHVFCSYMINDLRRDPADVSIAAGHGSISTTLEMYVGRADGALERLKGNLRDK
jgi:integrase